jgi:ABC-type Fe3+ transport system permease subunit
VIFLISANWNLLTPLLLSQTENLMLAQASITSLILCTTLIFGIYIIKKITKLGQERIFGKRN